MEYIYQVEALKDDYGELEEKHRVLNKQLKSVKDQHRDLAQDHQKLQEELSLKEAQSKLESEKHKEEATKFSEHIQKLQEELVRHKLLLEEAEAEKARLEKASKQAPVADEIELARETNKQTREYLYKWKMAEQENSVLQTSVNRLENQVARCKESLEEAETVANDLNTEKRKLLREKRELEAKVEELETNNSLLQKRLDRLRSRNLLMGGDATSTATNNNITPNTSLNNIATSTSAPSNQ